MIKTLHLFPLLDEALISLLRSLNEKEWNMSTGARAWTVRDIAAHLLDGNLRNLSSGRDSYQPAPKTDVSSYSDLVSYLNNLNRIWVEASRRLSPRILTDLLETSNREYVSYLQQLSPMELAIYPVGWAGESQSLNWFHIAREYTEKWHHQQQIREATGREDILHREMYQPVLETFMQALPYTFSDVDAVEGTTIQIRITGESGGTWLLEKNSSWTLSNTSTPHADATTIIDQSVAWKVFCKNLRKEDVLHCVQLHGDRELALKVLDLVAVMA